MRNLINFLWSGFGTGVTGLRAVGMALITLLLGVIVLYYIIRFIVGLFRRSTTPQQVVD